MLNIINKLANSNDLRTEQLYKLHGLTLKVRLAGAITSGIRPFILSLSLSLSLSLKRGKKETYAIECQ